VGILSETDIYRVVVAFKSKTLRSAYENIGLIFSSSLKKLDAFSEPAFVGIEDIFTSNPTTIEKDADLAEAAKIMIRQDIGGIPVVESSEVDTTRSKPIGVI
jgi:CBS domain-containing protein